MTFSLAMLRNAHNRDELVICYRLLQLCMELKPDLDWSEAKEAFKKRATELNLRWKQ